MKLKHITLGHLSKLHLVHPGTQSSLFNDDGSPMTITLVGEQSEEHKSVTRKWQNEILRKPNRKLTAEQVEERGIDLLVACTKGWQIQFDEEGLLPFSPAQARELYADPAYAWIKQQVDSHIGDAGNFLGESSGS